MSQQLNARQMEVVNWVEGPLLVMAGAGSGKTRVVTMRIARLLELGVPAARILAVTFTNKAAAEMRYRVTQLTQSYIVVSTFHSLGLRILRESIDVLGFKRDFAIYDAEDRKKLIKNCIAAMDLGEKKLDVDEFKTLISRAKNDLISPGDINVGDLSEQLQSTFPSIYQLYQAKLREYQALDFDDLIFLPVRLFREHPSVLDHYQSRWDFVLIDEYQDTNAAQYAMMSMLVAKSQNLCVVGDPDQSIYSWRGANIKNILNFETDYPGAKVVSLEENYRSTPQILEAANAVIHHNAERYEKKLRSVRGEGDKINVFSGYDDREEASFVVGRIVHHLSVDKKNLSDIAILYRTHFQSRVFEDELLSQRIPYVIVGGVSFYERREIKDLLAFLRVVHSGADFISLARTINLPKRGMGDATMGKIQLAAARAHVGVFDFCVALLEGSISDAEFRLTPKVRAGLKNYIDIILQLRRYQTSGCSLKELVIATIDLTGYLQLLASDPESFAERKENVDSLIAKAVEWAEIKESNSLALFLDELTLKSAADESDTSKEKVTLMTLHHAKGLEFPIVFLVGLEEGLFPHINSMDDPKRLEEERRLCYVGMTRARDLLYISAARSRLVWGMARQQDPSRFLRELPAQYCQKVKIRYGKLIVDTPQGGKPPSEESDYAEGDLVNHNDFGVGTIRSVAEHRGIGKVYSIFFVKSQTERTLVAKYAKLSRIV